MSELQTEDVEVTEALQEEAVTEAETGTDEVGAELAPATGDNQEEKTHDAAQEAANKAINKKHFQYKEEERKRLAAEKELEDLRAKLATQEQAVPDIPPMPDPYSDTFAEDMAKRDEAIRKVEAHNSKQQVLQEQQRQAEQKQLEAQQREVEQMVSSYNTRATALGLEVSELDKAGNTLVEYGVTQDIAQFLLTDEDGPLMTKYLAANPLDLERVQSMSPMQAAITLHSEVRQKASALKPKVTSAPEPPEALKGGGMSDDDSMPNIKGATFE